MAKYRYTMRVKKIVYMTEETFTVIAENEKEAKRLAREEAAKHPEEFEKETTRYIPEVYSYSCNPVDTDDLSEEPTEDQLNDWFDQVDRNGLLKMFTMPYGWSEQTDMNDFVDYCDKVWSAFTLNDKKEMYNKYHTLV